MKTQLVTIFLTAIVVCVVSVSSDRKTSSEARGGDFFDLFFGSLFGFDYSEEENNFDNKNITSKFCFYFSMCLMVPKIKSFLNFSNLQKLHSVR
jgi:hypothetical protein